MATIEVKDSQEKEDLIRIVKNQENREFEKARCFFYIICGTSPSDRRIILGALIVLPSVLRP